ncbi:MAG: hypothetical protein BWZ10_03523 [candidate division BRC1 bacterium ADurb.BinA364]|nr:MAG: hypothetical protein BWZ10_03523 [candidate division BRC1 bacterium ADurb.BinA364]
MMRQKNVVDFQTRRLRFDRLESLLAQIFLGRVWHGNRRKRGPGKRNVKPPGQGFGGQAIEARFAAARPVIDMKGMQREGQLLGQSGKSGKQCGGIRSGGDRDHGANRLPGWK